MKLAVVLPAEYRIFALKINWVSAAHIPGKNNFHILRRFSKLGTRQSLTDVNKHWHLTSLCNLMYPIHIYIYLTRLMSYWFISFFNKRFPWIRVPLRYLFTIFRFLKNLSETVIIGPKVNKGLSIYFRLEILRLLSA